MVPLPVGAWPSYDKPIAGIGSFAEQKFVHLLARHPASSLLLHRIRTKIPYEEREMVTPRVDGWQLRTCDRMIFLAGSEVRGLRVCCQTRERTTLFGWPSACAWRLKPPPIRLGHHAIRSTD